MEMKWVVIIYEMGAKEAIICESKREAKEKGLEKVNRLTSSVAVVYTEVDEENDISFNFKAFEEIYNDR